MQNKHRSMLQEELMNQYWFLPCTRLLDSIYFATLCQIRPKLTSLVRDCLVTEILPIAVSSKEQFVDTYGLFHVKNDS